MSNMHGSIVRACEACVLSDTRVFTVKQLKNKMLETVVNSSTCCYLYVYVHIYLPRLENCQRFSGPAHLSPRGMHKATLTHGAGSSAQRIGR